MTNGAAPRHKMPEKPRQCLSSLFFYRFDCDAQGHLIARGLRILARVEFRSLDSCDVFEERADDENAIFLVQGESAVVNGLREQLRAGWAVAKSHIGSYPSLLL